MIKTITNLFIVIFLIGLPALAKQNGNDQEQQLTHIQSFADKMPKDWFSCSASKDCGLVWYNCMAEAFATNELHLKDAQGVICQTELCSWLKCPNASGRYYAACEDGQCRTKVGADPLHACSQDRD